MFNMLQRENESVRDRFYRVLWMATLINRLSKVPLPDRAQQLDEFVRESRELTAEGTPKPKARKSQAK
jgi:hypothetical protein